MKKKKLIKTRKTTKVLRKKKKWKLVDTMDEEVEEDEEEPEAPELRKSNRVASRKEKGKTKVVYPKKPKRKKGLAKLDLPRLDEVPRRKMKLLEASSIAASKGILFSFRLNFWFSSLHFLNLIKSFPCIPYLGL